MRTSLTEIRDTELYLHGKLDAGDKLVFEARLLTDPELKSNMQFQQKLYKLLRSFHLKRVRQEIAVVQDGLFDNPEHSAFQQKIHSLFK